MCQRQALLTCLAFGFKKFSYLSMISNINQCQYVFFDHDDTLFESIKGRLPDREATALVTDNPNALRLWSSYMTIKAVFINTALWDLQSFTWALEGSLMPPLVLTGKPTNQLYETFIFGKPFLLFDGFKDEQLHSIMEGLEQAYHDFRFKGRISLTHLMK